MGGSVNYMETQDRLGLGLHDIQKSKNHFGQGKVRRIDRFANLVTFE